MTPAQKNIVRRQAEMDADVFLDLLTWFIKESGHKGYKDLMPPDDVFLVPFTFPFDGNLNENFIGLFPIVKIRTFEPTI